MPTVSDLRPDDGPPLRVVQAAPADTPQDLAGALGIGSPCPVVVIAGGDGELDDALHPRLLQLLGRGLLRSLHEAGAAAVLRGSGALAELVGKAVEQATTAPPLIGVAPAPPGATPSEARNAAAPGISHLLLTSGIDEAMALRTRVELTQALAAGAPVSMVLFGGGAGAAAEVLQAVRRRWPVIVVQGSGGAADAIARQLAARAADGDEPVMAEILADGRITCITLGDKVAETVETLARQVLRDAGGESVLRQAWKRFGAIDAAAIRQQVEFFNVQWWILALGVIAVALAILQTQLTQELASQEPASQELASQVQGQAAQAQAAIPPAANPWYPSLKALSKGLRYLLIVVPIGLSTVIAATNRFKPGKRWVLLRSAAESIKREIYRFRLRTSNYAADKDREKNLAQAVEDITRRLARTEANTAALPLYAGPIPPKNAANERDDGISGLDTDQYVRLRLVDQLAFYRRKTVGLEATLRNLQYWVLGSGAVGTLLAALGDGWVIWIALTTAVSSAAMTYLSYRQTETTLTGYNQTATDLENIQSWWTALPPDEQALPDNIEALATHTEQVLSDELAGWTQRMTDALEKLRGEPDKTEGDKPRDGEPPAPPAN